MLPALACIRFIVSFDMSNSPPSDRQSSVSIFSLMGDDNNALGEHGGMINMSYMSGSQQGKFVRSQASMVKSSTGGAIPRLANPLPSGIYFNLPSWIATSAETAGNSSKLNRMTRALKLLPFAFVYN